MIINVKFGLCFIDMCMADDLIKELEKCVDEWAIKTDEAMGNGNGRRIRRHIGNYIIKKTVEDSRK